MSQPDFDTIELSALEEAGSAGGAFLESLDKTDLAGLTNEQWLEFLERIVDGFGCAMRNRLVSPHIPA